MILFLTLIYVGLLFVLVKCGVIKWNMFWKTSPVLWMVALLVFLFIPMQWGAPQGNINMYQEILEVIPNVSGQVSEINTQSHVPMKKGDPIFTIDPTTYQANVSNIEAQLSLARLRFEQSSSLAKKNSGSRYDVEQYEATIQQLEAQLEGAKWNLEETVVRAPSDGYVVALALQKGQRVANAPLRSWVSFVKESKLPVIWIPQTYLRHVQPGQEVEVSWKLQPGKIHKGTVVEVAKAIGQGQWIPTGIAPTAPHPHFPPLSGEGSIRGFRNTPSRFSVWWGFWSGYYLYQECWVFTCDTPNHSSYECMDELRCPILVPYARQIAIKTSLLETVLEFRT